MTLCEWCTKIPFDLDILQLEVPTVHYYDLGSGVRIESSQCPFCWLIISAFSEDRRAMCEYRHVRVWWAKGLKGRWAYKIMGVSNDIGICFGRRTADHPTKRSETGVGYWIEPTTRPVVDTARMLRWISSCEQMHGPECGLTTHVAFSDAFPGLRLLRLIDTEADCLVEKKNLEKYVALSYVWGAVSNFRLTKANRAALLTPGSLEKVSHLLPKTIKDAITLVQRLEGRYLWVDALCLLQNDTEDLDRGVNAMDQIYERAWLTVVAACGHDANARLPGVQSGTRRASRNTVEIKPGVEMGVVVGLDTLLKNSVYNSRAWT